MPLCTHHVHMQVVIYNARGNIYDMLPIAVHSALYYLLAQTVHYITSWRKQCTILPLSANEVLYYLFSQVRHVIH